MSGVAAIRDLLASAAGVTALVPAASIRSGPVPLDSSLPAIAITTISAVEGFVAAAQTGTKMYAERVQVTAYVKQAPAGGTDYPGLDAIFAAVRAACTNRSGTLNGVSVDSILLAGQGPDIPPDTSQILERSVDFLVKWHGG